MDAGLVSKHGKLAQVIQHLLIPLIVASDRTQPLAVVERTGYRRRHKEHEFHRLLPFRPYYIPFDNELSAGSREFQPGTDPGGEASDRRVRLGRDAGEEMVDVLSARLDIELDVDIGAPGAFG
jgi:hypothetical protein